MPRKLPPARNRTYTFIRSGKQPFKLFSAKDVLKELREKNVKFNCPVINGRQ